jgi:hypothetical protein
LGGRCVGRSESGGSGGGAAGFALTRPARDDAPIPQPRHGAGRSDAAIHAPRQRPEQNVGARCARPPLASLRHPYPSFHATNWRGGWQSSRAGGLPSAPTATILSSECGERARGPRTNLSGAKCRMPTVLGPLIYGTPAHVVVLPV